MGPGSKPQQNFIEILALYNQIRILRIPYLVVQGQYFQIGNSYVHKRDNAIHSRFLDIEVYIYNNQSLRVG